MPDSYTQYYNLAKVEVGGSRDTWGNKLNQNFQTLDTALHGVRTDLDDLNEDFDATKLDLTTKINAKADAALMAEALNKKLEAVPVSLSTSITEKEFPIGTIVIMISGTMVIKRNQAATVYLNTGESGYASTSKGSGSLNGIWRSRGIIVDFNNSICNLMQRVQ